MNQSINNQNMINPAKAELHLAARPVSRGIGVGKILCLYGKKRQFFQITLDRIQVESEVDKFYSSVELAKKQLKNISQSGDSSVGQNQATIFQTHLLFLEDKSFLSKIEDTIKEDRVNAEWAVKNVSEAYVGRYKLLSDKHLREKYLDLEDVTERLMTALGGGDKPRTEIENDAVIVAHELNPSTLMELNQHNPRAIITETGGWTSHTFILARELRLPAVTGLKGILRRVRTGDEIVVDGFTGEVILNPAVKTRKRAELATSEFSDSIQEKFEFLENGLKTLDGIEMTIRANLDMSGGYEKARRYGASGIGLYRSEFLFNQNRGFPTEEEQYNSYCRVAGHVGKGGVRIRTFDLSVNELADSTGVKENNPALGLRGIRFSLKDEKQFRIQLRALLRASFERNIDIVFPMISDVTEIIRAKSILAEERDSLESDGVSCGDPKIGVMIEVPSAVLVIDRIVREVDFISLGTNDLVQYLLAVDRDNEDVADWFRTLHPAVLKSLRFVIDAANRSETPVIICGEMAGSPLYVPILIGLGATELSMNLNSIPRVREVINGIAHEEAREIVEDLEKCGTSEEVEDVINRRYKQCWSHLFTHDLFTEK